MYWPLRNLPRPSRPSNHNAYSFPKARWRSEGSKTTIHQYATPTSISLAMAKHGAVYADVEEPFVHPGRDHKSTLSSPSPPFYGVPVGGDYPEDMMPARPYLLIPFYGDRQRRSPMALPGRRAAGRCDALLSPATLHALLLAGLVLGVASFLLWPSGPEVRLVHMKLKSVKVSSKEKGTLVALDISLNLKVRVRNRAFFALAYDNMTVGIEYRGERLGTAMALGGIVRARGVAYAEAKMRLDGIRVLEDALFLIEDLMKGNIPFEGVTMLDGELRFFSFNLPIQGRVSCVINVDVENQLIASQDCYLPERKKKDLR